MPKFRHQMRWLDNANTIKYMYREHITKYPIDYKFNKSKEQDRRLRQKGTPQ